jgi:hypothetical protein
MWDTTKNHYKGVNLVFISHEYYIIYKFLLILMCVSSSSLGPVSLCPGCTSAIGLLCSPKHSIQHRFNNPVPLIRRQRSLTEAVLISFGSAISLPKAL